MEYIYIDIFAISSMNISLFSVLCTFDINNGMCLLIKAFLLACK